VDDDSIVDGVTNPLGDSVGGTDGTFTGEVYAIDGTAPFVSSVVRADSNPSTGSSVSWTVTFSEPVSGVGVGDFALVKTCLAGAPALTGVSGGPTVYTVSASTGSGSGTLGLNVIDDDSIIDAVTNALGASDGGADGRFTGEVYTTDGAPNVCSITRVGSSPTNASTVSWTVTFSEPVSGVGAADFTLVNASLGGSPAISGVAGTAPTATYTVTASTGSGNGSLGLNLVDDDSITDAAANKLGGVGAGNGSFIGQVYSIDRTPPTAFDIQGDPTGGSDSGTMDSGDKIVYTFSEEMSAGTILTGWTGSSTAVTVHVDHRGSASDCVTTNSCLKVTGANLGEVDLGSSVYAVNHGARYDLAATMEMATVAGRSVVTITLGATGGGDVDLTTTLKWTPSATAWDLAGNAASTTQVTESGAPKQNF
jgi:hypothetical protein